MLDPQPPRQFCGAIGAAVIDDQQLNRIEPGEVSGQIFYGSAQRLGLVEAGYLYHEFHAALLRQVPAADIQLVIAFMPRPGLAQVPRWRRPHITRSGQTAHWRAAPSDPRRQTRPIPAGWLPIASPAPIGRDGYPKPPTDDRCGHCVPE